MRVLHVIPSLDPTEGGPSVAVPLLARALTMAGVQVTILTTERIGVLSQVESGKDKVESGSPLSEVSGQLRKASRASGQTSDVEHQAVAASLRRGVGKGGEQRAERERPTLNAQRSTLNERGQSSVVRGRWSIVDDDIEYVFTQRSTRFYKVSWELVRWLRANIRDFDLVHIHALFSFSSTAAAFIAGKNKVPYIIRPLGVLNRWGLENRRAILKRASLASIEKRILTRAAAIHYTSEAERAEAGRLGAWLSELNSFISPLPVEKPTAARVNRYPLSVNRENLNLTSDVGYLISETRGRRVVLFLSRIDRKKGIELLLSAFATVRSEFPDVALVIAGSGDQRYEATLREQAKQLEIDADVIWTGFLDSDDKAAALAAAEIFVLPSYSENFGIAAAEAFAAGKACILSDQVGLADDARRANAAVITRCDVRELAEAMNKLLADREQQRLLGDAARRFATERLSMAAVGEQLEEAYRVVAGAAKQTSNAQRSTPNAQ